MLARILLSMLLCLLSSASHATSCLGGTALRDTLNIDRDAVTVDPYLPDGATIAEFDFNVAVEDPASNTQCAHEFQADGIAVTTPVVYIGYLLQQQGGANVPSPQANYFYSGIPGIFFSVSAKADNTPLPLSNANIVYMGNGKSDICTSTDNHVGLGSCASGMLATAANQAKFHWLTFHAIFKKFNANQPLQTGSYTFQSGFMDLGMRADASASGGNLEPVAFYIPFNIAVASTCYLNVGDQSNMPTANFPALPDSGALGAQLGGNAQFAIDFTHCAGSPVPNIQFALYNSDQPDALGNFPLYQQDASSQYTVAAGIGFQIVDQATGTILKPGTNSITNPIALSDPRAQYNSATGLLTYPNSVNTATWTFVVQVIKSKPDPLAPGAFQGHANFTIAYQ